MDKPRDVQVGVVASGSDAGGETVVPDAGSQPPTPERDRRLNALLDALPAAIYTTDAAGSIAYYNEAAAALWGRRPVLGASAWCGAWKLYWPDGTPMAHDQCPMAIALKEQRAVRGVEAVCERSDGTRVAILPYPSPLFDDAGRLIGAVNMLVDITERKQAEEQQALLLRELHHRVKNTLANVQAIMGATARSAETIEAFQDSLIGRIASLARTHRLLADESHDVRLGELLRNELAAFDDGDRIVLSGPPVEVSQQLAVSLGMAIHELTVNAAKFGALSVPSGKVEATWHVTIEATRRTLDFDWVESGGPPVTAPARNGFGTRLLEQVLPVQLHARTSIDYRPEGVHVHYTVPLPLEG